MNKKIISISLGPDTLQALDTYAVSLGLSRSAALSLLIRNASPAPPYGAPVSFPGDDKVPRVAGPMGAGATLEM